VALDGIDLLVRPGVVVGLLGPNGAGKTTALRLLLGLVRPDGGHIRILGKAVHAGRGLPDGIGGIVERPAAYPYLSGRANLEVFATAAAIPTPAARSRIDELITCVDLTEVAERRVAGYSAGMKARLAIAIALLRDPAVVLLDEPASGLDPGGVADLRALLAALARRGRTILLSSHLLAEVQRTCDEVVVMARGRILFTGSVDQAASAETSALEDLYLGLLRGTRAQGPREQAER
jgi:ABC-2 type transport system ATP-binding protein